FLIWMALNPRRGLGTEYREGRGVDRLRREWDGLVTAADRGASLPYPSANRWILEEPAFWLTCAHMPNLVYCDFDRGDVLQNGELAPQTPQDRVRGLLCHYFTQNLDRYEPLIRSVVGPTSRRLASKNRPQAITD